MFPPAGHAGSGVPVLSVLSAVPSSDLAAAGCSAAAGCPFQWHVPDWHSPPQNPRGLPIPWKAADSWRWSAPSTASPVHKPVPVFSASSVKQILPPATQQLPRTWAGCVAAGSPVPAIPVPFLHRHRLFSPQLRKVPAEQHLSAVPVPPAAAVSKRHCAACPVRFPVAGILWLSAVPAPVRTVMPPVPTVPPLMFSACHRVPLLPPCRKNSAVLHRVLPVFPLPVMPDAAGSASGFPVP